MTDLNKLADAIQRHANEETFHADQIYDDLSEAARILRAAGADVAELMEQAQVFADAYTEWVNYPTNQLKAQHDAARAALESALRVAMAPKGWRPIETAPKDEGAPFLVLLSGNDVADFVVLQVSWFEGHLYPDHMDGLTDWDDRITDAKGWMPLAAASQAVAQPVTAKD